MIGQTIAHYRILEELGRGGMGVVYKAHDTKLNRPAALKVLKPELLEDEEHRQRFLREALSAAAVTHPYIASVYDAGEADRTLFIAMEYVEGKTLRALLAKSPLPIPKVQQYATEIAEGLAKAHQSGLVHRDIKPDNVMVASDGHVKILDFGLAKIVEKRDEAATMTVGKVEPPQVTTEGTILGTPAYMSPEQALGREVDRRTDIWSFGCLLYEILAGQAAFQGGHEQAIIQAIVHGAPQPIVGLRHDIPLKLVKVLGMCLQKDPQKRYQDVQNLIEDLKMLGLQNVVASSLSHSPEEGPSIAVLPFVDMSPEKDQDYFGEGIAEELIHALTRIRGLHVVSRTSAFAFKGMSLDVREIGQTLNVEAILEGSVRKAGNRVRITVQLINVEDGFHLWSERFDRDAVDIFAIQDEISLAIVESLRITLQVGERTALKRRTTEDLEAYNLYLKGLHFASRPNAESLSKALDFFRDALDRDPSFALAYVGMGRVFSGLGIMNIVPPPEMRPKAKAALEKALRLEEDLPEAHVQNAALAMWFEWDWDAAGRSFERVLALNPSDAFAHGSYAWFMLNRRRFDDAIREIKKALALDPLMPLYYAWSVGLHTATGRYDEAIREFASAMEIEPKLGLAHFHAGLAYAGKGELDTAIESLEKSKEFGVWPGWAEAMLMLVHLKKGEKQEVERTYQEQLAEIEKARPSFTCLAWQAAALGDFDRAFEFFDKAYDARDLLMPFVHVYTELFVPALQHDPRFNELLRRMKLAN